MALGKACEIAKKALANNRIKELTDYFYKCLIEIFGENIKLNGDLVNRLPNTLNVSFLGYNGSEILSRLGPDIAAATGSACHSGSVSISHVLKAMNIPYETARGAVRFSLGRYTTQEEIDIVLRRLSDIQASKYPT